MLSIDFNQRYNISIILLQIIAIFLLTACHETIDIPSDKEESENIIKDNITGLLKSRYSVYFDVWAQQALDYRKYFSDESGQWSDIDYSLTDGSAKGPVSHLERTRDLAFLYKFDPAFSDQKEDIVRTVNRALDHWRENKYVFSNWWHNSIGSCTKIGETLTLMGEAISEQNLKYFIEYLDNGELSEWKGANLMDYAWFHFMRGNLLKSDSIISTCCNCVYDEIKFVEHEGIQVDYSFLSSDIRYIGGYAEVYLKAVTNFAYCVRDTKFAIPADKLDIIRHYVLKTYIPSLRSKYLDWNTIGRQISRRNHLNRSSFILPLIDKLKEIDPEASEQYEIAKASITDSNLKASECCYYYKSELLSKSNDRFSVSVGGSSNRVRKPEKGNGENLLGSLLSLGSTSYRVNGDEYYNIFNCWDWTKIPGVTATNQLPQFKRNWGEYGGSSFSGGVCNGENGAYSFIIDAYKLKGYKSYYLTDYGLLCIGSSLEGDGSLLTTIDQCIYRDDPLIFHNNAGDIETVGHNNIFYHSLSNNALHISIEDRDRAWEEINTNGIVEQPDEEADTKPTSKKVFTIWLEDNSTHDYAYYVVLNPIDKKIEKYISNISVLSSNKDIHAAFEESVEMLYLTFFKEGSFLFRDLSISVDKPCIIMGKMIDKDTYHLYISEPTQQESKLTLNTTNHTYNIDLPTGVYAGNTVAFMVKK